LPLLDGPALFQDGLVVAAEPRQGRPGVVVSAGDQTSHLGILSPQLRAGLCGDSVSLSHECPVRIGLLDRQERPGCTGQDKESD
jgi:hypothetical protein